MSNMLTIFASLDIQVTLVDTRDRLLPYLDREMADLPHAEPEEAPDPHHPAGPIPADRGDLRAATARSGVTRGTETFSRRTPCSTAWGGTETRTTSGWSRSDPAERAGLRGQ
ncbi:MAG: hypothetical protein M0C28_22895 [Candidatus Moduliflexus flocculans]|nr:hypothetical protein [Candidatus Moduliflexus flocculans]